MPFRLLIPHLSAASAEAPTAGGTQAASVVYAEDMPFTELKAAIRRGDAIPSRNVETEETDSRDSATTGEAPPVATTGEANRTQATTAPADPANDRVAQLQEQLRQANEARTLREQELAQLRPMVEQVQAEQFRQVEERIATLPPEQQAAIRTQQAQERLEAERAEVAAMRLESVRERLPQVVERFAAFVAEQTQAPPEVVQAITRQPEFAGLLQQFSHPSEMRLISNTLVAAARVVAERDKAQAQAALKQARKDEAGTHRTEGGNGAAGEYSEDVRIGQLSSEEFMKRKAEARKSGTFRV